MGSEAERKSIKLMCQIVFYSQWALRSTYKVSPSTCYSIECSVITYALEKRILLNSYVNNAYFIAVSKISA